MRKNIAQLMGQKQQQAAVLTSVNTLHAAEI
jgi:hypothetical protein